MATYFNELLDGFVGTGIRLVGVIGLFFIATGWIKDGFPGLLKGGASAVVALFLVLGGVNFIVDRVSSEAEKISTTDGIKDDPTTVPFSEVTFRKQ